MTNNNPEEKVLTKCRKLYEILKNKNENHSLEERASMVRYLEKKTCPTYIYLEKNGKRSIKKRAEGFRDRRHFFEHIEGWLRDETEQLSEE